MVKQTWRTIIYVIKKKNFKYVKKLFKIYLKNKKKFNMKNILKSKNIKIGLEKFHVVGPGMKCDIEREISSQIILRKLLVLFSTSGRR